jgi:L-ribulokinase
MNQAGKAYTLGLDFGTESVRAVIVSTTDGHIAGQSSAAYAHGVIDEALPVTGQKLPAEYALQHPGDWLDAAAIAVRAAVSGGDAGAEAIVGIGVDFTSCTMLPARADGTPLCLDGRFAEVPLAWPRLWKHHAAHAETALINEIASARNEPWLARYGGVVGLEWLLPKILEAVRGAPAVHAAAELWMEAGDWLVWQLTDGPFPACTARWLVRSTCQAGYKGLWDKRSGYPSASFLAAVDSRLTNLAETKLAGKFVAPGQRAGTLTAAAARLLGLQPGTPISAAIIDAHAGVPGAGVAGEGTLVMVMGTSSCHMLNSRVERTVPGVAGVVEDGILPGFFGYETGQASVGDAFAWLVRFTGQTHGELNARAAALPPGCDGVIALDWLNGCRTPLMDGRLGGLLAGLRLGSRPEHVYRALMEATAMGVRWIVDVLRGGDVPVENFVASGGLPAKSPLLMQIYADVLNRPIRVAASDQSVALGAAILGALVADPAITGHRSAASAIAAMSPQRGDRLYTPDAASAVVYDRLYGVYRKLAAPDGVAVAAMHELSALRIS